jgi:hypothetical protein
MGVAGGAIETLSHAFMDCPVVQPAVTWLCDVWKALSGEEPPRDAAVLIADDHRVWAPADKDTARLWTRLRVAFMGSLWATRCNSHRAMADGTPFATRVAAATVAALTSAIKRDWRRAQEDVRTSVGPDFCQEWFRGRDPTLEPEDFIASWATPPYLCDVVGGLVIKVTHHAPVPLPV